MYQDKLKYQPILSANVITLVSQLQDKTLSSLQFHNKKAYCKRQNNLLGLVELTIAWEIYKVNIKEITDEQKPS